MKGKFCTKIQAVLWIALSASCGAANAQPATQHELAADETYRFVPVKNIAPDILAWRIDPQHQPEPKMIADNRQLWNQFQGPLVAAAMTKKLPPQENNIFAVEVRALVPVENPRGLFVAAGDDEWQKLREIVALLDQPQRGVEIGIKLVRFNEKSKIGQQIFANKGALNGNSYTQFYPMPICKICRTMWTTISRKLSIPRKPQRPIISLRWHKAMPHKTLRGNSWCSRPSIATTRSQ